MVHIQASGKKKENKRLLPPGITANDNEEDEKKSK